MIALMTLRKEARLQLNRASFIESAVVRGDAVFDLGPHHRFHPLKPGGDLLPSLNRQDRSLTSIWKISGISPSTVSLGVFATRIEHQGHRATIAQGGAMSESGVVRGEASNVCNGWKADIRLSVGRSLANGRRHSDKCL